jgi:hypothetical protein
MYIGLANILFLQAFLRPNYLSSDFVYVKIIGHKFNTFKNKFNLCDILWFVSVLCTMDHFWEKRFSSIVLRVKWGYVVSSSSGHEIKPISELNLN